MSVLLLSGRNESGANKNNESGKAFVKTKEYVWCQNKDYVGGWGAIVLWSYSSVTSQQCQGTEDYILDFNILFHCKSITLKK